MAAIRNVAALFGVMLGMVAQAQAQAQQPAAPSPDEVVVRAYNVSDLLQVLSNYPLPHPAAPGALLFNEGNPSTGTPLPAPRAPQQVVHTEADQLMMLIQETIDRETWRDNGGNIGSIRMNGMVMVVAQSRKAQDQIQSLLNEIRRTGGPNKVVTLRLTWVQTESRELLAPTSEVTAEWLGKQKVYCESQITCFSGQTVHQVSGKESGYISDLTPIVGTNAVAFDPQIGAVRTGVAMQISPQLIPDSEIAIVDVHANVSEGEVLPPSTPIMSIATVPNAGGAQQQSSATVDRVNLISQQFKTTARVPLRKKVIIGGMTLEPSSSEKGGRQLYLVVEMDTVK